MALVITIIVILILVGVTVTVAINGGLFEKSKEATKKTLIEKEKEELASGIVTAYDGTTEKVDKTTLEGTLPSGWTVDGEEGGPYTATSPSQNTYNIAVDGTITDENKTEKTIKFTIEGDTTEYTAIEGMNLEEWIKSKYNTTGYSIDSSIEIIQPGNNIARLFYTTDKITDGCTIKEHVIHFTIGENSYICPEYFNSWEEWVESKYNTIIGSSTEVLESITIDGTRKGACIDKTSKPEEGHAYGWSGPVI